ncbi:MAG: transposase [Elusimicrobiota bacterium]|nr:MAG: transposase [Elusimicrobiota bacterium]
MVVPKRLRYFVHRDARLPGEISRLLAETLTDFHLRRGAAPKDAAPAQFHVLQRFGSSVNLHRPHGGFSLDGGTYVEAQDRAGLERLLLYVLRPALSLKQLVYKPEQDLVTYRPSKGRPDSPAVLEWTGGDLLQAGGRQKTSWKIVNCYLPRCLLCCLRCLASR